MPRKRNCLGKDAKVEVLTKYLHRSRLTYELFQTSNPTIDYKINILYQIRIIFNIMMLFMLTNQGGRSHYHLKKPGKIQRWPCSLLSIIPAITEVNCQLVLTHIYKQPPNSQQAFRKILTKESLFNAYLNQEEPSWIRKSSRLNSLSIAQYLSPIIEH